MKEPTFAEREKRHREINKRIHEAYPMAGNVPGNDDALWRSLSSNSGRDLNQITQKRMQEIAFYLFDTNPMAHRILEITRDFVVGDGFKYTAKDPRVLEIIDDFWNDPDNDMDCSMDENILELCQFGENCFPTWINRIDGGVKIGYIDPSWIIKVTKDRRNPRWYDSVIWKRPSANAKENISKIVRLDNNPKSDTYGRMIGDVFYFAINKPINASRGRSDLLSLADWLDGYDQFLFARLERAFLLNTFIWDITADGMTKEELETFLQTMQMPKPGSIRAHNEKIKWTAVSPSLEGTDASNEAKLFRNQILGGAGFPEHWFATGDGTTRATAQEMGLPTLKKLKSRQKKITYQYKQIIRFVIDQAIIAGSLPEDVDTSFELIAPSIMTKDDKGLASVVGVVADALIKAQDKQWITDKEAQQAFKFMFTQFGMDQLAVSEGDLTSGEEDPEPEEDPSLKSKNYTSKNKKKKLSNKAVVPSAKIKKGGIGNE